MSGVRLFEISTGYPLDMNNTQLCWQMEIVPGMPHGFLAFGQMSTECQMGVDHVTKKIGELIRRLAE